MLAALLALSLFHHSHPAVSASARSGNYAVGSWQISVRHDRFTGRVSCSLKTLNMHVRDQTVIFRVGNGIETTNAYFRVNDGPAKPVSIAFADDEKRGIFPERGTIDDPFGGETALPLSYFSNANVVWIRTTPHHRPQRYVMKGLSRALVAETTVGCTAGA